MGLVLEVGDGRGAGRFWRSRSFICATNSGASAVGMAVGTTSAELLDACLRLLDLLLDAPEDIPILSSLIQREIIYRLLRSEQGRHLRAIATLGEQGHLDSEGWVEWLRKNYAEAAARVEASWRRWRGWACRRCIISFVR